MKQLLYKEWKLCAHPTMYLFPALAAMLLIPSYPYYVAFIYTALSVFFVFQTGRENDDVFFSATLPVRKRDIVKARCGLIAIVELLQVLVAIPFAILGAKINPNPGGNMAGIEANAAFFGLVLAMYALFNGLYLHVFYESGYKSGKALLIAGSSMFAFIGAAEILVQAVPSVKAVLDTWSPEGLPVRIAVLVAGIAVYALGMIATCRDAGDRFEKVDL